MATYYVDSNVAGPGSGTFGDPWDDLASNVNTKGNGPHTFYLRGNVGSAQVYTESVTITVDDITVTPYGTELVEFRSAAGVRTFDIYGTGVIIDGKDQLDLNKAGVAGAYIIEVRSGADYCTIKDCEIRNATSVGRLLRIEGSYTTVDGCVIHDCFKANDRDACGVSIEDGEGNVVENCTIYDVHGDCIYIHDALSPNGTIIRNNTLYTTLGPCSENGIDAKKNGATTLEIYGNTFHGFRACTATCGGSGDLNSEAISIHDDCDKVEIRDNVIYNCSNGIFLDDGVANIEVHNNIIRDLVDTATDPNAQWAAAITIRATNVDVFNNTFCDCPDESIHFVAAISDVVIRNNIFKDCGQIVGDGLAGWTADHNCWYNCTDTLSGTGDVTDDPEFVNEAGKDYGLGASSPCIDAGVDVGLAYYGTAPDMGAEEYPPGFTLDALIVHAKSDTFTASATVKGAQSAGLLGDAIIKAAQTGSALLGATIGRSETGTATLDATVKVAGTGSALLDMVIGAAQSASVTVDAVINASDIAANLLADAIVKAAQTGTFTADARIQPSTITATFTANTAILRGRSGSATLDAMALQARTGTLASDAAIRAAQSGAATLDGAIKAAQGAAVTTDAAIRVARSGAFSLDAVIRGPHYDNLFPLAAAILGTQTGTLISDAAILQSRTNTATVDAVLLQAGTGSIAVDTTIRDSLSSAATVDAVLLQARTGSIAVDTTIRGNLSDTAAIDAVLLRARTGIIAADATIKGAPSATLTLDAYVYAYVDSDGATIRTTPQLVPVQERAKEL